MKALLDSQISAKEKLQKYKVGALFMDTGTGKTRVLIELVNSINDADLVVYIAPFSAINPPNGVASIIDEVDKWGGFNCEIKYIGAESIGSSDRVYLNVIRMLESSRKPVIIVDESIKIANFNAKRTKRILDLSKSVEYKLIANATPLTRDLLNVWSQIKFLSPKILNMSLAEFENTFCIKTKVTKIKGKNITEKEFISGYANIDYLYSLIGHYVYECDLINDIEEIIKPISFYLTDDELTEYNGLKAKYLDNEFLIFKNNNIFLEMTQKMQHLYSCSESKKNEVDKLLKSLNPKRTVIYCKYIDSQEFCKKNYPDCLILSYQKNATSINLQYDFDNIIFWEKVWDYYLVKQAKGRINRVGRKDPINYFNLTANVGLDSLIDKNLDKKISMVEYIKKISLEQLKKEL